MNSTNKLYKALELYELSIRKGRLKKYQASSDNRNKYQVKGFVVTNEVERKNVIEQILPFSNDTIITAKILNQNTHYIVGLFDLELEQIIEGTLFFGNSKEILERFNKKISGHRYKEYFKNVKFEESIFSDGEGFGDLGEAIDFDEDIKAPKEDFKDQTYKKYNIQDLERNLSNSRNFLTSINKASAKDRIQKMGEITIAFEEYEKELKNTKISDELLDEIINLKFGAIFKLKEKALEIKEERIRLKEESRKAKREREEQLEANGD